MAYWYNVDTGSVEIDETRPPGAVCLGPYETEHDARRALEIAKAKTDTWDAQDREWNEGRVAGDDESLED